jgi:ATP diphosphatase
VIIVAGLGAGTPESVPAVALAAVAEAGRVLAPPLEPELLAALPVAPEPLGDLAALPFEALIVAPDAQAHRIARRLPDARTLPGREALRARAIGAEVAALAAVGLRLRRECPWDREQTAQTIVPHTIEEAFEVADAVARGGAGLADELGDLLFQSVFLAQLLEEDEGGADLADVARGQSDKLIGRHPHVYGEAVAADARGVVDVWERQKRREREERGTAGEADVFYDLPVGLPALAYATKTQKRAAAVGFDFPDVEAALGKLREETAELEADPGAGELGDVLFAAVGAARAVGADPELALRASATRFRERVERATRLAAEAGQRFDELSPDLQLRWYEEARR